MAPLWSMADKAIASTSPCTFNCIANVFCQQDLATFGASESVCCLTNKHDCDAYLQHFYNVQKINSDTICMGHTKIQ